MQPDTVMIFAAGFGTRMGPLTQSRPKPLLEVAGRNLIDRTLDLAMAAGLTRKIVNTHHLAGQIAAHLKETDCVVLHEAPDILDTGGGLKAARPYLGHAPVFTANPDTVWSGPNPFTVLSDVAQPANVATLLLVPLENAIGRDIGDFQLGTDGLRRRGDLVYTGIQIIRPDAVIDEPGNVFSLNRVWDRLIDEASIGGAIYPGVWCDVGSPDGLKRAEGLLAQSGG